MSYQIVALPLAPFAPLFSLSEEELAAAGARRWIADQPGRAPCRVSLRDADTDERLILVNYVHLSDPGSPYRASGPVFVRESAVEAGAIDGPAPEMLAKRALSLRVYDKRNMMIEGEVIEGRDLDDRLAAWFGDPGTHQVHVHSASRGCYLARAVRS